MTDGVLSLRPSASPSGFFHVLHFLDRIDPSAMQQRSENAVSPVSTCLTFNILELTLTYFYVKCCLFF